MGQNKKSQKKMKYTLNEIRNLKPYQITIIVVGMLSILVLIAYILTKIFGEEIVTTVFAIGGLVAVVYAFATMISTANDDDDDDDDGKTYY